MRIRTAVFQADTSDCRQRLRSNRLASLYNKRVCVCVVMAVERTGRGRKTQMDRRGGSPPPLYISLIRKVHFRIQHQMFSPLPSG